MNIVEVKRRENEIASYNDRSSIDRSNDQSPIQTELNWKKKKKKNKRKCCFALFAWLIELIMV